MMASESAVTVNIDGRVTTKPKFVKHFGNVRIFRIEIESKRLSGVVDKFLVNYTSELSTIINEGDYISISGDIRTLNDKNTGYVIEGFIFAKSIKILSKEPEKYINDCVIKDAVIDKFDELRKSFDDTERDIATYRIKLNRGHGRFSYFKVTTWDNDAVTLGNVKDTITNINLRGRLQSYVSKHSGRLYLCLTTYGLDLIN
jgi:hypothetical protein